MLAPEGAPCYGRASALKGPDERAAQSERERYGTIGLVRSMLERSPPTMSSPA
jgi:hypothetical protein